MNHTVLVATQSDATRVTASCRVQAMKHALIGIAVGAAAAVGINVGIKAHKNTRVTQPVPVGYGGPDADDGWPPHQPGVANPEGGVDVMRPAQLRLQAPALQEQHHGWKPLIPPNTQAPTVDIPAATSITRPGALADWQEMGSNPMMFTVKMRTHQGQAFTC